MENISLSGGTNKPSRYLWFFCFFCVPYFDFRLTDSCFAKLNCPPSLLQSMRILNAVICFTIPSYYVLYYGLYSFATMSLLTCALCCVSAIWNFMCTREALKSPNCAPKIHSWNPQLAVILFEVCFTLELGLTIVYWSLLYRPPKVNDVDQLFRVLLHTSPLLLCFMDSMLQQWRFKKADVKVLVWAIVIYGIYNLIWTKATGVPVYVILPWEDYRSLLVCVGLILHFYVCYMGLYHINKLAVTRSVQVEDVFEKNNKLKKNI